MELNSICKGGELGVTGMAFGIDIVEISRISRSVERWGETFIRRILTAAECDSIKDRSAFLSSLAGRFCAKEAIIKAFGRSVPWHDLEILPGPGGKPGVVLHGEALRIAGEKGVRAIHLSLAHSGEYAVAGVYLERSSEERGDESS